MKSYFITAMLVTFCFNVSAQQKKDLSVSVSSGFFNSPYYNKASAGAYYKLDADYHLKSNQILSFGFLAGRHHYYDDVRSNDPSYIMYPKGTNAEAGYTTFTVQFKYKFVTTKSIFISAAAGAGIITHQLKYPYTAGTTSFLNTSSYSDLVFPFTIEGAYKINSHFQAGLTSGFLIHPDYPILGLHIGPRISYVIQ